MWAQRGENEGLLSALGEDVAKDIVETMELKGRGGQLAAEEEGQARKSGKAVMSNN